MKHLAFLLICGGMLGILYTMFMLAYNNTEQNTLVTWVSFGYLVSCIGQSMCHHIAEYIGLIKCPACYGFGYITETKAQ